jgi:uncharacterized protein (DUF58 family)
MGLRQNALLLLLLTALLAIGGDWSGQAQLARFWCLPAGLLLLGLAYEAWIVGRATPALALRVPARWLLGRATPVAFEITHRLQRALSVELAPSAPPEVSLDRATITLPVPAASAGVSNLLATARRLGRYQWPASQARIGGVLGLAWWNRRLTGGAEMRVLPDMLRDAERALGEQARGARPLLRGGVGSEVLQLRDYQPGDPPRAIDWKASARLRRLISRDFAEDQHLEIILALDAGRASGLATGDTDRLALYANVAARLAQRAIMLDDRVGLLIYADRPLAALSPGHGIAALTRLRACLAEATVQPGDSNPALAAIRIRSLVRQRSLVVLLTDLDDAPAAGELRSAVRLLLPKHLPFIAGVASERVAALASAPARDELAVYRSLAAQEYCHTLARNVASLRALGAAAVSAAPRELDLAVLEAYLGFRQRRRV